MYVAGVCNAHAYARGVYKFLCVHGYNYSTFVYDVRCSMFDCTNSNVRLACSSQVESSIQVLEHSSRVQVRALECEGSDLRVKLEYKCSSARVLHIETRK